MDITFQGRARKFGDDINTDYVIASSRKKETLDTSVLRRYLMEGVDPAFAASVQPGDIIVAGRNFGCGSAMEIAVTVIQAAGIKAVLAQSFSRTFFRNAVNNGLYAIEYDTSVISEGDRLTVELGGGQLTVANGTTCTRSSVRSSIPGLMLAILGKGGLVPYIRAHGGFRT
jgi:3-isopropylmalate/(R)-2-methylmalate dehydratase small subunit